MNVSGLLAWFDTLPSYQILREDLSAGGVSSSLGLLRSVRPAIVAGLMRDLRRPMLVIAGSVDRSRTLHQALQHWHVDPNQVLRFPEPPSVVYERTPWTQETTFQRLTILGQLLSTTSEDAGGLVVVASARSLMQPTLPVQQFRMATRPLQVGRFIDLEQTLRRWAGIGYEPVSVVEGPGQFSHRGGILDIFPPTEQRPVRIELFGDEIESIRAFNPATQRSETRRDEVTISPAREPLPRHGPRVAQELAAWFTADHPPEIAEELDGHREALEAGSPCPGMEFYLPYFYSDPASLIDYLPKGGFLVVDDLAELSETWAGLEEQGIELRATAENEGLLPADYPLPYLTWADWEERLADWPMLVLGQGENDGLASELAVRFRPCPRYGGQLGGMLSDVEKSLLAEEQVIVASRQARRLAELWSESHELVLPVEELRQPPQVPLTFVQGPLQEGWVLRQPSPLGERATLRLLTDAEIFGWRMPEPRRRVRRRRTAPESLYADLARGTYVTHIDYGVGVFHGLLSYTIDGEEREYLVVDYAEEDRLYVPVYQADRLSRYVGADDRAPTLDRLGSAQWNQAKARTREAVEEIAREMLDLYAKREVAPGYAFSPDTTWQAELEASFPYMETPDQATAVKAVKADMERTRPMDRLICGDVGYGKTEVALRAAFKAVMDGKQVAILVPTTVLAQQHYTTFGHRLNPFPVNVEMLSRFRTGSEQDRVLRGLEEGMVDVVIGTHRLLQKDIAFNDLGLVIIDEEQRFGVTHKERLKKMRTEVDVLTMTATPIPRTLYLSLTGVRDISVIETPPEERLPVATYVGAHDDQVVRRAILRELERSGQVFYVHNRVQTIETVRQRLERLVPEAKVAVAHGQMREKDLERAMVRFVSGEIDVLLCTSIIESGLDIPNANTLVVEQAELFGLAQMYQLRGRVGRGARRAYAYFLYRPGRLTSDARQRLETIREASDLGAGYTIAMRDLELRGAGEILGTRQSGHISAVGFDLYMRLLTRAVEVKRAEREGRPAPPEPLSNIRIDLPIPIGLPADYVPDDNLRLRLYRRLANLGDLRQVEEMSVELEDRFGPLPQPARNLIEQLRFKVMARDAGVESILIENDQLVIRARWLRQTDDEQLREKLDELAHASRRSVMVSTEEGWKDRLWAVLATLEEIRTTEHV
jgi:transcription-repair coupling factor (superfamily II helicase)